jgi:NADPH:quinone reductase-like Zn-dependent oxidoreductase
MSEPNTRMLSRSRALALTLVGVAACALTAGCGNTIYAFQVNSASNKVEEAKELGAENLAPYEYYYAREHLQKAMEEAAEADYSDAINLAETSEEFADKAIRLTKQAERGAGR